MRCPTLLVLLLAGPLMTAQCFAQTVLYKCPSCGRYHERAAAVTAQPTAVPTPAKQMPTTEKSTTQNPTDKVAPSAVTPAVATQVPANAVQPATATASATNSSAVQTASATQAVPSTARILPRWRFHNANKWARRIDSNAQAWAQKEANLLAQRGYQGYLRNGHPGGANPHATVTGTGTTFVGADLIHTCEGSNGMTLVAEAAAVSADGRIYGVRSWR